MELEIGAIQEGKVTGITKFGAFVLLPGGKSGLVHISEIANAYVNDVNDYLKVGDAVKVKILSVNEAGKINLSIKQTQPSTPRPIRRVRLSPRRMSPARRMPRALPMPTAVPRRATARLPRPPGIPALRISSSTSCSSPTARSATARSMPTAAPEAAAASDPIILMPPKPERFRRHVSLWHISPRRDA